MPRFKVRVLGCAVALLAALALATPAHATSAEVSCTIEGSAAADVRWVGAPIDPGYTFGPPGLRLDCVFVKEKTNGGSNVEAGVAEVVGGSAGQFDSEICGTGTAADADPSITSAPTTPDSPNFEATLLAADLGYNLVFVGFEGVLTWDWDAAESTGGSVVHFPNVVPTPTQPVGGGFINISPWRGPGHPLGSQGGIFPGSPLLGLCTNGFNVEGVVTGVFA